MFWDRQTTSDTAVSQTKGRLIRIFHLPISETLYHMWKQFFFISEPAWQSKKLLLSLILSFGNPTRHSKHHWLRITQLNKVRILLSCNFRSSDVCWQNSFKSCFDILNFNLIYKTVGEKGNVLNWLYLMVIQLKKIFHLSLVIVKKKKKISLRGINILPC